MANRPWRRVERAGVLALLLLAPSQVGAEVRAERFVGRPEFSEGRALGYFVWRDGDTWKVRWTTFGARHRFTGRVVLVGGELQSLRRVDLDTERRVIRPGRPPRLGSRGRITPRRGPVTATIEEDRIEQETEQLIRFNTRTDDDLDGFDFKVDVGTRRLQFVLEIDGSPRPDEVEVGRDNFKPNESPLVVVLR